MIRLKAEVCSALRTQLQSDYFAPKTIRFLQVIKLDIGLLVFYCQQQTPFSLGVCLLCPVSHQLHRYSDIPIWRSSEKIQPMFFRKNQHNIRFVFHISNEKCKIYIQISDIVKALNKIQILKKAIENPILTPNAHIHWESQSVFNPAVLLLNDKVHFIYRAVGHQGQSVFGYACSQDGFNIQQRSTQSVYPVTPYGHTRTRTQKHFDYGSGGSCCGVEDPRLVKINDTIYMLYTAFDGSHPPGVHLTSISVQNFLQQIWRWSKPLQLSPVGEIHKNWVMFPELIQNQHAILHSISPEVRIDYFSDISFEKIPNIKSYYAPSSRTGHWDSWVRGVGPTPLSIKDGWLVFYHAMMHEDPGRYKLGAMILAKHDPTIILYRTVLPLLEPDRPYENIGHKAGVIYCCGAAIKNKQLLVYYGGADQVICLAHAPLEEVVQFIKQGK